MISRILIPWKDCEYAGQVRVSDYLIERGFQRKRTKTDQELFERGSLLGNLTAFHMRKIKVDVSLYRKRDFLVVKYRINTFGQAFTEDDAGFFDLECKEIESVALGGELAPPETWEIYDESVKGGWLGLIKRVAIPVGTIAIVSALGAFFSGAFENKRIPPPNSDSLTHELSDFPAVYLVPLDGFPVAMAQDLASWLSQDTGLFVKATPAAALDYAHFNEFRNQYAAESFYEGMDNTASMLPGRTEQTAVIFVTDKDIYFESANFRFVFSAHWDRGLSLVGTGRYGNANDELNRDPELFMVRTLKLLKRAIGLQYFGHQKVSDPESIMFSPITGIPALDRIDLSKW